jgi:hypothetical protein
MKQFYIIFDFKTHRDIKVFCYVSCLIRKCLRITLFFRASQVTDEAFLDLDFKVAGHALLAVHMMAIWNK